jgi:hypothetical protein
MLEIEHQAEHWDEPEHGEVGHLIAQALRAAVDIARCGGLQCEHRGASEPARDPAVQVVERSHGPAPLKGRGAQRPSSAA